MAQYLMVIGDREALGWVLTAQRMAFPDFQRAEVRALAAGDGLFLYTTRGCYGNPTRDRGRVIARGRVVSAVTVLDEPVSFGGRSYPVGCDIAFSTATAWPEGVELAPLVPELELFRDAPRHWSVKLRRPLVRLSDHDAARLDHGLAEQRLHPLGDVLDGYARWWRQATAGQPR